MSWKFTSDKPVYIQIADRIVRSILSGEYSAGGQIPSVRQLALEAAVNPNTIQHAFSELENEGIIISKGTLGRFVTDDVQTIENSRLRLAEKIVKEFSSDMMMLSLSKEQVMTMLEEALK